MQTWHRRNLFSPSCSFVPIWSRCFVIARAMCVCVCVCGSECDSVPALCTSLQQCVERWQTVWMLLEEQWVFDSDEELHNPEIWTKHGSLITAFSMFLHCRSWSVCVCVCVLCRNISWTYFSKSCMVYRVGLKCILKLHVI
jgi:hypothetical protein